MHIIVLHIGLLCNYFKPGKQLAKLIFATYIQGNKKYSQKCKGLGIETSQLVGEKLCTTTNFKYERF